MFQVRDGLFYTKDHEWIKVEGNKAKFGIDDYAQHEMGDLVYIEVPKVGTHIVKDEEIGAMESVKSVEPIYAPVSGTIVEINGDLDNAEAVQAVLLPRRRPQPLRARDAGLDQ